MLTSLHNFDFPENLKKMSIFDGYPDYSNRVNKSKFIKFSRGTLEHLTAANILIRFCESDAEKRNFKICCHHV